MGAEKKKEKKLTEGTPRWLRSSGASLRREVAEKREKEGAPLVTQGGRWQLEDPSLRDRKCLHPKEKGVLD